LDFSYLSCAHREGHPAILAQLAKEFSWLNTNKHVQADIFVDDGNFNDVCNVEKNEWESVDGADQVGVPTNQEEGVKGTQKND
jgi:hypothetical protein